MGLTPFLAGWLLVSAMMTALWFVQRARRDAGVVDVGWAAGLGILALVHAAFADTWEPRRWLVAALACGWSFRLAGYLYVNRIAGHREEDGRYQALRAQWGGRQQPYLFAFFQAQGVIDVLLSLPFWLALRNPEPRFGAFEMAGIALWAVSVGGESLADRQLARFRADPANRGRTCRDGLWRWSRHPNYFFEWLHWWSWVLVAWAAPLGWTALSAPLLMGWFLWKVTGIPATEARALVTRGDDYRDYQRTTSPFVPWFPKRAPRAGRD